MSKIADKGIGYRSYDFLLGKFETLANILKSTKIKRSTLYQWKNGDNVPSAYWLQYLTYIGADPKFLLTGKRSDNNA